MGLFSLYFYLPSSVRALWADYSEKEFCFSFLFALSKTMPDVTQHSKDFLKRTAEIDNLNRALQQNEYLICCKFELIIRGCLRRLRIDFMVSVFDFGFFLASQIDFGLQEIHFRTNIKSLGLNIILFQAFSNLREIILTIVLHDGYSDLFIT